MHQLKKDDLALMIACMMGQHNADNYADGVYNSVEIYEELTGNKIGLKRPESKKWYQFWK
jgi:hypothetical protein